MSRLTVISTTMTLTSALLLAGCGESGNDGGDGSGGSTCPPVLCPGGDNGGNGGNSPPPPPPGNPPGEGSIEGLWVGSSTDDRAVVAMVTPDGATSMRYWILYSASGDADTLEGVLQGPGAFGEGEFASSFARNYVFDGSTITNATLEGVYDERNYFDGTASLTGGGSIGFETLYEPAYDTDATLAAIAGSYSGSTATAFGIQPGTLTISPTGAMEGETEDGCTFFGDVVPAANNNSYTINYHFGGGTCENGTHDMTGTVFYDEDNNLFVGAAENIARVNAFVTVLEKDAP